MAIPGFLGGVSFAALLSIAEGRRRFDELSVPRCTAWGAVVGLLIGVAAVSTGMGRDLLPLWLRALALIAPITLGASASASATLSVARLSARRAERRLVQSTD